MSYRNILRLVVLLLLSCTSLTSRATGQEGDIIYIDGEKWQLLGRPICHSKSLYEALRASLPKDRDWTTANWDGFTACWSIKDDQLVLDSVLFTREGVKCIKGESLLALTDTAPSLTGRAGGESQSQVVASWYSDTVRVAKGHMLLAVNSGYDRHYETEMFLSVNQGRVTARRTFNNSLLVKGFSIDRIEEMPAAERDTLFRVDTSRYPELKDVGRILFQISKPVLDVQGNLLDCQIKCTANLPDGRKEFPGLADDFKRILMNIKPWQVYRINGELVNRIQDRYYLPVKTQRPTPRPPCEGGSRMGTAD